MSKNFLDSVDLTVPFGSASNLPSSSGSHRPWVKSWLPGLALKASYSLVPGNLSAFLSPALPIYARRPLILSVGVLLFLTSNMTSNISALPNSYSASKPQLKYPTVFPQPSLALTYPFMADIVMRSHSPSSGALAHLRVHAAE